MFNMTMLPARRHLRLPAKPAPIAADTKMLDIDKKLDLLLKASVEGQERAEPKSKAPLFSDAADAYIESLRKTHGSSHDELGYLLHRKTIFIAIVGDLRVDQIRKIELQDFVDEIAHISPNFSRQLDYNASEVKAHIKANKDAGGRGLSQKTILDTYLSRIKTIVRFGLEQAGLSYHLTGTRLTIPKTAQPPKRRESADPKDFDAALKYSFAEKPTRRRSSPGDGPPDGTTLGGVGFSSMRRFFDKRRRLAVHTQNSYFSQWRLDGIANQNDKFCGRMHPACNIRQDRAAGLGAGKTRIFIQPVSQGNAC